MIRNTGIRMAAVGICFGAWCGGAWGNGVVVRLVNPGSATVTSGTPFELRVVADIADVRLSAVAYDLSVTGTGDARAWLNGRSADPNEINGLTYISETPALPDDQRDERLAVRKAGQTPVLQKPVSLLSGSSAAL